MPNRVQKNLDGPRATGSRQENGQSRPPETLPRIDPDKVRVVDIEEKETGKLIRRDCYDPEGEATEMTGIMRLIGGELYLRVIGWARSNSQSEEIALKWEPTGLGKEEVGRIGVFTWPRGEPVRVFGSGGASPEASSGAKAGSVPETN